MGNLSKNRWGLELARGMYAVAHHPRGGSVSGIITRIAVQPGYGKRASLDNATSVGVDDVFKAERFVIEERAPKEWHSVFPSTLAEHSQPHGSLKAARDHIKAVRPNAKPQVRRLT